MHRCGRPNLLCCRGRRRSTRAGPAAIGLPPLYPSSSLVEILCRKHLMPEMVQRESVLQLVQRCDARLVLQSAVSMWSGNCIAGLAWPQPRFHW